MQLFDHQREGIQFLLDHPHAALFDEPGLGKTRQLLMSAVPPVVVVAPAMILNSGVWDDEIEKIGFDGEIVQVPYTSLTQKGPKGQVYRNGMGMPTNPPKAEYWRRWGTKIADESHYLASRKANWTTAFLKLEAARTDLSTGTPIPNWAHEAFTQLQAMFPGKAHAGRELGSYWRWAREWFQVGPTVFSPLAVGDLREDRTWDEFYEANWGNRMLRRLRAECLDLPPLTIQLWRVQMRPGQRRIYRELEKNFVSWLDSGAEVAAWSSASQLVKLAKCATGVEILEPGAGESAKLDALREILSDRPRPTLVVAHFRDTVDACARVCEDLGKSVVRVRGGMTDLASREAVRAFQRGNAEVMCASIEKIAEGLTLHQAGADQVVRVERSYRPHKNKQVVDRLYRIGQEHPVLAIDLVTVASCDVGQMELLEQKTDQQLRALTRSDLRRLAV